MTSINSVSRRLGKLSGSYDADMLLGGVHDGEHTSSLNAEKKDREGALETVRKAEESISRTTFQMWDRHAEMVRKSQVLYKAKIQKDAIERRNRQDREHQTQLLAERAIENARRSAWLNAASRSRRNRETSF